jgi:3-amino-4-hydroxybenzoic acid synthase
MRVCWIDLRAAGPARDAIRTQALHQRIHGIVADTVEDLVGLPPTVKRVLWLVAGSPVPDDLTDVDVVIGADVPTEEPLLGRYVEVVDAATLDEAVRSARSDPYTVVRFADPTKIPLEIVLAAAAKKGIQGQAAGGAAAGSGPAIGGDRTVITVAQDVDDAKIIFGVLEHGSGVLLAPADPDAVTELARVAREQSEDLALAELRVVGTRPVGMGDRVCVDTCTYLRQDEGILVGSHSKGFILCVSETHPLPYMPTRPFRVNAGAVMSYTLDAGGRTRYLTELVAGSTVLAVDAKGGTRVVTVGRAKIESRPLLSIDAVADDGRQVNLIVQNDWHVRILGPGGVVLNTTELAPGDVILGYLPTQDRHVGYPITEFCLEQ